MPEHDKVELITTFYNDGTIYTEVFETVEQAINDVKELFDKYFEEIMECQDDDINIWRRRGWVDYLLKDGNSTNLEILQKLAVSIDHTFYEYLQIDINGNAILKLIII